jgi:hypothetical protein
MRRGHQKDAANEKIKGEQLTADYIFVSRLGMELPSNLQKLN